MPIIIANLWTAFIGLVGVLVAKVLVSLGIGYVAYTGLDTAITWAKAEFLSGMAGLPAYAIGMASTMKIGVCVSMLLSALTARLVFAGMTSGAMKRMVTK